jgi:hypothetical protein
MSGVGHSVDSAYSQFSAPLHLPLKQNEKGLAEVPPGLRARLQSPSYPAVSAHPVNFSLCPGWVI